MPITKVKRKRRTGPYKYPWASWLSRRRLSLRKGIEYQGPSLSFLTYFRAKANKAGLTVNIAMVEDGRHYVATMTKRKPKKVEVV